MKRNFNFNLQGFDKKDLLQNVQQHAVGEDGEPMLKDGQPIVQVVQAPIVCCDAVVMALCQPYANEDIDADAKMKRAEIAQRIFEGREKGEVDISLEEAGIIKHCVGKAFAPIVVLQIMRFIEG